MSINNQGSQNENTASPLPVAFIPKPVVVFSDVDDTLTCDGVLPVETYSALVSLQQAGIEVVPVTGASAGWCDCLIKTWPINHIIGENGAVFMEKDDRNIVTTHYVKDADIVERDLDKLMQLGNELSDHFPEVRFTQDQPFRLTDVAFDIGQAVTVEDSIAEQATLWLLSQNVAARRSSIHINVWIGEHSKASTAMSWLGARDIDPAHCLFIGDSPNDESMFERFPVSVGVANVQRFLSGMDYTPTYITESKGGYGFVEMVNVLLD